MGLEREEEFRKEEPPGGDLVTMEAQVIRMAPHILLFDKAGKLVGAVKDGKMLVDEKGREIREITNRWVKISDLIKELVQRKLSGYVA